MTPVKAIRVGVEAVLSVKLVRKITFAHLKIGKVHQDGISDPLQVLDQDVVDLLHHHVEGKFELKHFVISEH